MKTRRPVDQHGRELRRHCGSCIFVFFTLLAIQGVLLQFLPGHVFPARFALRAGDAVHPDRRARSRWWAASRRPRRGGRRSGSCACGRPSSGAARLRRGPRFAPSAARLWSPVVAYLASYHRYRRLLLEALPGRATSRVVRIGSAPSGTLDPAIRANRPLSPSSPKRSSAAGATACCCWLTPASRSAGWPRAWWMRHR